MVLLIPILFALKANVQEIIGFLNLFSFPQKNK